MRKLITKEETPRKEINLPSMLGLIKDGIERIAGTIRRLR